MMHIWQKRVSLVFLKGFRSKDKGGCDIVTEI